MNEASREKRKLYMRRYYRENRAKLLAEQKARDAKVPAEKKRAYRQQYWAENRARLLPDQRERGRRNYQAKPEQYRARNRKHRIRSYGLTLDQYDAMLTAQNGCCLICEQRMTRPAIDHCHTTGKVRGLLCGPCNRALGLFRESPRILRRAAAYVTSSSSGATSTTSSAQSSVV